MVTLNRRKTMRLPQLARVLACERAGSRDRYISLGETELRVAENPLVPLEQRFRLAIPDRDTPEVMLTPTAVRQLTSLAGLPEVMLERLPPSLAINVMHCMLSLDEARRDQSYLFRIKQGTTPRLRAVLPSSFVRLDDAEVLETVMSVVDENRMRVAHTSIDDDLFSMRLLFRDGKTDVGSWRSPDPAHVGIDVRASETGRYPLQVRHLIYRQVCSNGMTALVGDRVMRRRMSGLPREQFRPLLQDAVESALTRGQEMASRMAESRSNDIEDPMTEVEGIFQRYRLGSPRGAVGRWIVSELAKQTSLFGVRRFDVVQAFTAVAQGLEHAERVRMEDAMGRYLMEAA